MSTDSYDPFDVTQPKLDITSDTGRIQRRPRNPADWLEPKKYKRGFKRYEAGTVHACGNGVYLVDGMDKMSDSYDDYEVRWDASASRWRCSCQTHQGGGYRRICSHSIAVMIWRYETWGGSSTDSSATSAPMAHAGDTSPSKPMTEAIADTIRVGTTLGDVNPSPALNDPRSSEPGHPSSQMPSTQTATNPSNPFVSPSSPPPPTVSETSPGSPPSTSSPKPSETPVKPGRRRRRVRTGEAASSSSLSTEPAISAGIPVSTVSGNYPAWLTEFRDFQVRVATEIVAAFEHYDVVFLDAPTGAGKSLIGWTVGQMYGAEVEKEHHRAARMAYLASDKSLQDQFLADFFDVGARNMKGRVNYLPQITRAADGTDVTCDDCNREDNHCDYCPNPKECSYVVAKKDAARSPMPVLNYAYAIREMGSSKSTFCDRDLIVADEADVLENVLLGQAEVVYGHNQREALGLGQPSHLVDNPESWVEWLTDVVYPAYKALTEDLTSQLRADKDNVRLQRRLRNAQNKLEETELLIEGIPAGQWVLTGYKKEQGKPANHPRSGPMIFKPVHVGEYGRRLLLKHSRKWLLMSATIINPHELADSLGINAAGLTYTTITAPMTFPVERRQIYATSIGEMTRKHQDQTIPQMVQAVGSICESYPDERKIIHTVSYALADKIADRLRAGGTQVFTYRGAREKEAILEQFFRTPGAALVGPTIGRGTDFKDDRARINIICKLPFPYLGDEQVKARRYCPGGSEWYITCTIRDVVQSYGRTTRSATDSSITFILDAGIHRLMSDNRSLFPEWFLEAVNRSLMKNQLMEGRNLPTLPS